MVFILSLGYASLYSTGLGERDTDTGSPVELVQQTRDLLRFARRLSIAQGVHVQVKVDSDGIALTKPDGSQLSAPANTALPFRVDSPLLRTTVLYTADDDRIDSFVFNEKGQPMADAGGGAFQPLKAPIQVAATGYDNEDDDGRFSTDDQAFLLISNLTGELIPL